MRETLYITNYSNTRCSPLQSITRLTTEDAYLLAKGFSKNIGTSFTSFSRFGDADFDGYYKKRMRTEEWLYNSFIAIGGKPKVAHPLYFVLGESSYLNKWFEGGLVHKLALSDIEVDEISFTFGDSMSKMDSEDRMDPFDIESLINFIDETSDDFVSFLKELDKQNKYIEAQLWNDAYVKELNDKSY